MSLNSIHGHYERDAGHLQSADFLSIKGKISVSGNNLMISCQPEKFTRDFSCDMANNYTKTMSAKTEKHPALSYKPIWGKNICVS
jgi:hypothetical protein